MKLTKKEVEHIAQLARLELTDEEKEKYGGQLSAILAYVEKMNEADTEKVEPTSQTTGLVNIMREDKIEESRMDEEIVKNAPESENGFFKIPKVFENK